jgi:hypothetical protein
MTSCLVMPSLTRRSKIDLGPWVMRDADHDDVPQSRVGLAITAAIEPMSLLLAAAGFDR